MKNTILKNNFAFLLLLLVTNFKGNSQSCMIIPDSTNYATIEYINTENINMNGDNFIMLLSVTPKDLFYFKVCTDSLSTFLEYGNNRGFTSKIKIPESIDYGRTSNLANKYYILSNIFSREIYDMLIIKKMNRIIQIIPTGSTIFSNIECIKIKLPELAIILEEFKYFCIKYFSLIKINDESVSKPVW